MRKLLCFVLAGSVLTPTLLESRPASPPVVVEKPRVDAYGDPAPDGAVARFGTARFRQADIDRVALSPDGRLLALYGSDEFRLLDTATGKVVRRISDQDRAQRPCMIAFSPDGRFVALWGYGRGITIFNVANGSVMSRFNDVTEGDASSLSFSGDGRLLALAWTAPREKLSVTLLDLKANKLLRTISAYHSDGAGVLSPDGKLLATWSGRNNRRKATSTIRLWDLASGKGKELHMLRLRGNCRHVCFSVDGKQMLSVENNSWLCFYDVATGKLLRRCDLQRSVGLFRLSADGKHLTTGAEDGTVQLWDTRTGRCISQCPGPPRTQLSSLAFLSGNKVLAAGNEGQAVRLWEVPSGHERTPRGGHVFRVCALAFSRDGKTVLSGAEDGVRFWQVASGNEIRWIEPPVGERGFPARVSLLSPCSRYMIWDKIVDAGIQVMETNSGKVVATLRGGDIPPIVVSAVFAPDGGTIAYFTLNRSGMDLQRMVRVWDLKAGRQTRMCPLPEMKGVECYALSGGGKMLAVTPRSNYRTEAVGDSVLWNLSTGKQVAKLSIDDAHSMKFSPDGELLASSTPKGLLLHDTVHGRRVQHLELRGQFPEALAFSPDGRTLAVATWNQKRNKGEVHLWELVSGKVRATFSGQDSGTESLAFSPDGRLLAAGGADTTVILWDVTGHTGKVRPSKVPPTATELAGLWADLSRRDATTSHLAMARLTAAPVEALALFRKELKPAAGKPPSDKEIQRLIADLGADTFAVREKANHALAEAGQTIRAALVKALAVGSDQEQKRRLERLLTALVVGPRPHMLRPTRSLEVLERLGTPEAWRLVKTLATGNPASPLTNEAAATLKRLQRVP